MKELKRCLLEMLVNSCMSEIKDAGKYISLSHDSTVIYWVMLCPKIHMITCAITLWHVHVISLKMSVSAMQFHVEKNFILKAIKFDFKGSYS